MDTPMLIGTGFVVLGAVVWIVCIVAAYQNAPRRGRRPVVWAVLTLVFGPLALFALYLMAPQHGTGRGASSRDPRADLYEVPKKH